MAMVSYLLGLQIMTGISRMNSQDHWISKIALSDSGISRLGSHCGISRVTCRDS